MFDSGTGESREGSTGKDENGFECVLDGFECVLDGVGSDGRFQSSDLRNYLFSVRFAVLECCDE